MMAYAARFINKIAVRVCIVEVSAGGRGHSLIDCEVRRWTGDGG